MRTLSPFRCLIYILTWVFCCDIQLENEFKRRCVDLNSRSNASEITHDGSPFLTSKNTEGANLKLCHVLGAGRVIIQADCELYKLYCRRYCFKCTDKNPSHIDTVIHSFTCCMRFWFSVCNLRMVSSFAAICSFFS